MGVVMSRPRPTILPEQPPSPEEIRAALVRADMSQLAFAAWCGSAPQTVRAWLTDRGAPSHRDPPRMLWFALWAAEAAAEQDDEAGES